MYKSINNEVSLHMSAIKTPYDVVFCYSTDVCCRFAVTDGGTHIHPKLLCDICFSRLEDKLIALG